MRRTALSLALGLSLFAGAAYAQISDTVTTATVTNSSAACVAQNNLRKSLTLDATGASQNIGYCEGASCTAAIGTAGTTTLFAGTLHYWPSLGGPRNAFNCIAVSGSQPLTIREGN